jgi:hypothetical protein
MDEFVETMIVCAFSKRPKAGNWNLYLGEKASVVSTQVCACGQFLTEDFLDCFC